MTKTENKKRIKSEIEKLAGRKVLIASVKNLNKLLFVEMGVPVTGLKPLKSGLYPMSLAALKKIKNLHPVVPLLVEYKSLDLKKITKKTSPKRNNQVKKIKSDAPKVVSSKVGLARDNQIVSSIDKAINFELKRIILTIIVLVLAFLFFRNMSTDYDQNFTDTVVPGSGRI